MNCFSTLRASRRLVISSLLALSAITAFGQTAGEITGHVSDTSGASIPGATATLTNTATNGVRTTETTGSGDYTFTAVPPGVYNLKTEHAGFKSATSNNLEVQVQQSVRLDVSLQVGQVSETVEVSAQADLLQAENASVGTVIENKGVVELPLNGRNYLGLVALSANVNTLSAASGQAGSREGGDRANQSISAGGQRIMFDYFTLDGVNNTDPDFNTYIALPSIDAIQEFKVQTGVYPAEFGHEATQINVLTKSGGNEYHASLFDFVRNDKFDAVGYAFGTVHPVQSPFKWNDYGFEIDGPVRIPKIYNGRDRLFFMANDEWRKQRAHGQTNYTLPTAAELTGNLGALSTVVYDPNTGAGGATKTAFTNNVIPTSRIDPISAKLLNYYGAATLPTLTNNFPLTTSSPNNRDGFTLRMDFVESSKSQWSGRYSWGDENQSQDGIGGLGSKIVTNYEQYLGSNTRTITPSLVNEARYGYSRLYNSIGTLSAFTTDVVGTLGVPGLKSGLPATWGIPAIGLNGDGFSGFGDNTDGPYVIDNNNLQIVDNVSWIHGQHTLRFGFEYNRANFNQIGNQFSRGNFVFQANATLSTPDDKGKTSGGDALAEFLLGDLYQSTVAVAIANAKYQRNVEAAFVDDTYKITPKLTLSLGLRYELTPPWDDTLGDLFIVNVPHIFFTPQVSQDQWPYFVRQGNCTDPYAGLSVLWTKSATDTSPTVPSPRCSNGLLPHALVNTQYKNFAPRFGVSWSPDSKLVIRTGFGLFYNQDVGNAVFDMSRNIAGRVTLTSAVGTPTLFYNNAIPGSSGSTAFIPPPFAYANAIDHATSYTMQYLFNVQRQMGGNWVLEGSYLGTLSHHLYGFQNENQAIPWGYLGTVATPLSARTPFANYGVIQSVADGANADYNAFSLKATRRFSAGISVISSYTFSKSIDDTSGIRTQGFDTLYPQNSNCISCERALSSFDVRHRSVTSILYDLPIGRDKLVNVRNPVMNGVVGGWQIGGILTLQSGVPGTVTLGGTDNASTGNSGYDRPNFTGISPYLDNPTPSRWLNPAAYTEAGPGLWGNVGRNTIESPGIFNIDAEVHKQFRMPWKENHILQFRIETFNTLNHPNWGMPSLNVLNGAAFAGQSATAAHQNFGVVGGIASNTTMRQIQLGLKYSF